MLTFIDDLQNRIDVHPQILRWVLKIVGVPHLGTRIRSYLINKLVKSLDISSNAKILDVGSGYGFISLSWAQKKYNVLGVDGNSQRVRTAQKLAMLFNLKVKFLKANIYKLPFDNHSFDTCLCLDVLQHLKKDYATLKELFRVTRRGGYALISFPNLESDKNGFKKLHHIRAGYTISEFEILAKKAGFQFIEYLPWGKSIIGSAVLKINFQLMQISPLLSTLAFPLFYLLLLTDLYLPSRGYAAGFVVVLQKEF